MRPDTRSALLEAAAELLDIGGPAAVTLREVGRRAGVSHNAPYKHFEDKEALLAALAVRELQRLSALTAEGSGSGHIGGGIAAYTNWATAHPARFKLIFGAWSRKDPGLVAAAGAAREAMLQRVRTAQAAGQLPPGDPSRISSLLMSTVHGALDLWLAGYFSFSENEGAKPLDIVLNLLGALQASTQRGP